jgi:hypothetical protein
VLASVQVQSPEAGATARSRFALAPPRPSSEARSELRAESERESDECGALQVWTVLNLFLTYLCR